MICAGAARAAVATIPQKPIKVGRWDNTPRGRGAHQSLTQIYGKRKSRASRREYTMDVTAAMEAAGI